MNRLAKTLIPIAVGLGITTAVIAQTAPAPAPDQHQGQHRGRMMRERPSPETMQRLLDGRIAMVTTALKLTDDQKKLWAPVEAKIRDRQAARVKMMDEFAKKRAERQGQQGQNAGPRGSLVERMEQANKRMTERTQRMGEFITVFKPFYESLNDEQKKVVGPLMASVRGGHRGGHHGWAMNHRGPRPQ